MFDFHLHLARLPHSKQLTQLLLDRNYDFVAIACEPWEWREITQLKKEFSSGLKPVKVAYGIHPMIATQASSETLTKLRMLIEEDKRAMVGEAGIDKRYPGYDDGTQDKIFLAQAKLALEFKRHLQIHCVGDYMRVLKLLEEAGFKATSNQEPSQDATDSSQVKNLQAQNVTRLQEPPRPIFHRFGGDLSVVKKALPYGALFSLHADSFRKKSTAAAIPHIPQERVFFETDADETFMRGNSATANANNVTQSNAKGPVTSTATVDPGTGSGVTNESVAGVTSESAESDDNVFLSNAKDPVTSTAIVDPGTGSGVTDKSAAGVTFSPEEILAKLEMRLESVRAAYAKCRE